MTGRTRLLPAALLCLLCVPASAGGQLPVAGATGSADSAPATAAADPSSLPVVDSAASVAGGAAASEDPAPADTALPAVPPPAPRAAMSEPAGAAPVLAPAVAREAFGVSGALQAAVLPGGQPVAPALVAAAGVGEGRPRWIPVHGTVRRGLLGEPVYTGTVLPPESPGVWRLEDEEGSHEAESTSGEAAPLRRLSFITTVPFGEKRGGYLNGYHIGTYPTVGSEDPGVYAPPAGFIEVTPENRELRLSEHFRLGQFLTKDQFDVWPKYVVLNLRLIDKLELVLQELNAMGVRALEIHVMSGFRTPQYNGPGGDGRATLSRHMYGDAADIWIDGDRDGYIDDLNGDGSHDIRDAAVLLRAVERVEQKYPDLTGGAGLYESSHDHGPYVHVDVRGTRARW